jgi:hypothetical protein
MCARTDGANQVRDAADCLARACIQRTPKSYRDHLNDTLDEGVPEWAKDFLNRLK